MITLKEIREDLKDIRYYFSRKAFFDKNAAAVGSCKITETIALYNTILRSAPPRLFDLYISLYINNKTQEVVSGELGYTPEYIQMLNKQLLKYVQNHYPKKGEKQNDA